MIPVRAKEVCKSVDQDYGFKYHYRVESLASAVPSEYKVDKGTDKYIHVVGFNDPKDHEAMTRNYLQFHLRHDPDSDDSRQRHLSTEPFLCANAILTYYLRSAINRMINIEATSEPVYDSDIPAGEPIFKTDMSAIWL